MGGTIDLYPHPAPKLLNRGLGKRTSQRVYGKLFHYIHVSLLVPIVPQDKAHYIEVYSSHGCEITTGIATYTSHTHPPSQVSNLHVSLHVGLAGLRVLSANQGQCTQLTRYFNCIHFSQDNGCVHFGLPLWVLWYSGQLHDRRVVRRMHMGSWERVPRYGHINIGRRPTV